MRLTQRARLPILRARSAAVTAGIGGTLSLTTQPSTTGTSATALAQQPVVTTSYPINGVTITASLASGSGLLISATAITDSSGVATFSGLAISGADGAYRLQFTATNWNTATATADTTLSTAAASVATVSGTLVSGVESDIVVGGKTIILTVANDTWVASGATFNAQRQNIINGIDSAQAEAAGWDAVVKAGLAVTDVARTSNTVVTITLPAFASYAITANETITITVPSSALAGGVAVVATPAITVTNESGGGFVTANILNNALFTTNFAGFLSVANYASLPTGVSRDTTGTPAGGPGSIAVKRVLSGSGVGDSSQFYYHFYDNVFPGPPRTDQHADRVYSRFYFYFDAAFNGILKLQLFYTNSNNDYGGWYFNGGYLGWAFAEALFNGGTTYNLVPLSGLINGWHYLEADFWQQGDTANGGHDYPSVALYVDGAQLKQSNSGVGNPTGGTVWLSDRLNAGRRTYTGGIGQTNLVGNLNDGNTVATNIWINKVSISSAGRIGA